jgi:hypothetical protein
MASHVKVLGILFIVLGALGIFASIVFIVLVGGAAGIVGASAEPPDAAIAVPIIGIAGTAIALFIFLLSLPGVIVGYGLMHFRAWGRILGLVLSVMNLINVPFGTVLGVYGLWVLLSKETEALFSGTPALPTAPPIA